MEVCQIWQVKALENDVRIIFPSLVFEARRKGRIIEAINRDVDLIGPSSANNSRDRNKQELFKVQIIEI
jgi:hypothetical protein